ncbi:RNA polymerase sigma factor [bacterium]|nr:RNA polymerase sigma factor [bacterium]
MKGSIVTATDEQLLIRMQHGDEEAFGWIYKRYVSAITNFAGYMGIPTGSTEDVAQDVFLALIHHVSRFDPKRGTVISFLFGIARNRILRWIRDHSREVLSVPDQETLPSQNPLMQCSKEEQINRLRRAILGLPEHYREVVILCEIQELSYEKAAEVSGCVVGTVRSRLHRAREILSKRLQNASEEEKEVNQYELSTLETGSL